MKLRHKIKLLYRKFKHGKKQRPKFLNLLLKRTLRRNSKVIAKGVMSKNKLILSLMENEKPNH